MSLRRWRASLVASLVLVCSGLTAGPNALSVSDILKNPGAYLNKEVLLKGFTNVRFEDVNVYTETNGHPNTGECLSLLIPTKTFEKYKKEIDGKVATLRGILTSPACPQGSLCNWICNEKYGLTVESIAFVYSKPKMLPTK